MGENECFVSELVEWQLSLEAENDARIQFALEMVKKISTSLDDDILNDLQRSQWFYLDEDEVEDITHAYLKSELVQSFSVEQKKRVERAIELGQTATWRYGEKAYEDGLWDYMAPVAQKQVEPLDTLVLSGLMGAKLLGHSPRFDKLMGSMESDALKRVILVGELAMVSLTTPSLWDSRSSYYATALDGIVAKTSIGGTMHGDFWTSRQRKATGYITDPLGDLTPAAPSLENIYIPAYHSTETRILQELLAYQVIHNGASPVELFRNIDEKITGVTDVAKSADKNAFQAHPFGDFGDDDGIMDAYSLSTRIHENIAIEDDASLGRFIVYPGDRETFMNMIARKDGVEFAFVSQDNGVIRSFLVPSNEIEEYVLALFTSNSGRTSQGALYEVIGGLVTKPNLYRSH